MSPDAIIGNSDWALFLDVDGTLLEIAETPQSVHVSDSLKELLSAISLRLDGALALISGRTLDDLDHLFAPLRFCAAGVHGCERREPSGCVVRPAVDPCTLDAAHEVLGTFVNRHPGLVLEDKSHGLALHFRRAPHLSADADRIVRTVCERLGADFAVQAGKCVLEIRPAAWTKGASVRAFMQMPPFLNRMPVFVGDDLTDEHAFAVVNELAGMSIRVGEAHETLARHRLPSVRHVLRWLESVAAPSRVQCGAAEDRSP